MRGEHPDRAHAPKSTADSAADSAAAIIGRRVLLLGGAALLAKAGLHPALAGAREDLRGADRWRRPRALWVTRPQAQESVRSVYWADARIQPEGYAALNRIYRDLHANAQWPIAIGLLHLNFAMQTAVAALTSPRPLVLFSGYRTLSTNRLVGGTTPNIHGTGQADDYVFEGLSLRDNYRLAKAFQVGGLGLYPDRGSLHKDVGRLRSWVSHG